jgi:acetoin utilization deacetylase AcuC-like enzyme
MNSAYQRENVMTPALITHEISAKHDVPPGHPERPERYAAILDHIGDDYHSWQRVTAPLAKRDQLKLIHSESYIDMVFDVAGSSEEAAPLHGPANGVMNAHCVQLVVPVWRLIWS